MKILLLEDEIPAYEKLIQHLELHFVNKIDVDWSRTIVSAKSFLEKDINYDLIFSDIKLLDGISIDLFKNININCPIIFCTAYNSYVLDAFKSNGIAYILKPYKQDDINNALDKYNTLFKKDSHQKIDYSILKDVTYALKHNNNYKSRFIIKTAKGMHLLPTDNISVIDASGTFCKLIDDKGTVHVFSQSISLLYHTLNPNHFFKVNRSQIVNINHIIKMENYFKNRLLLHMKGYKDRVTTSSASTAKFRIWLDSQ